MAQSAMPAETADAHVRAPPLETRLAQRYYLFYALIDPSFFMALLHETEICPRAVLRPFS